MFGEKLSKGSAQRKKVEKHWLRGQLIGPMGAGAMFDWSLFDNWNRRKVVRQPSKAAMFDSDLV